MVQLTLFMGMTRLRASSSEIFDAARLNSDLVNLS
jgi:hypothetical protein